MTHSAHHVLMLSSSRMGNEAYLTHARPMILTHLRDCRDVLFIPYAGVTLGWDDYVNKVQQALPEVRVQGIHTAADPVEAVTSASAIVVGGGNTFNLLHQLYENAVLQAIREKVAAGTPYIGWSAGSNICGQSIRTTNDMPIVEPRSFAALGFLPCQLNPHYTDYQPPNHNGETRDDRLYEFTALNPSTPVLAIREGSALLLSEHRLILKGSLSGFVFSGAQKQAIEPEQDLTEYLN